MSELIDRHRKVYAAPTPSDVLARIRASGSNVLELPPVASEPEIIVRASYGPNRWQLEHESYVKGVRVVVLTSRDDLSRGYSFCEFPGNHVQVVNDKNIKSKRVRTGGIYESAKSSRRRVA